MSRFYVYLKVPTYLEQWMKHTFGDPIVLEKDCPEGRVLNEMLVKLPKDCKPDTGQDSNIRIGIPYFKGKNPETYNHLHKSGKNALIESFKTLFKKNLMAEIGSLENIGVNCKTSDLLYAYMEKHGIDQVHWHTISQIYHRTKKRYFVKNDIKIA